MRCMCLYREKLAYSHNLEGTAPYSMGGHPSDLGKRRIADKEKNDSSSINECTTSNPTPGSKADQAEEGKALGGYMREVLYLLR
jgi:hypothetical protein